MRLNARGGIFEYLFRCANGGTVPSLRCICGWAPRPARWRSNSASKPVRFVRFCHPAGLSRFTPVSSRPVLSSAGLHPAHALERCRTPQETAAGAKGKRAPLLHTMLPRLGRFQNSPLLNPPALQKMLTYLLPFYSFQIRRRLRPALLNPSCYTNTHHPPTPPETEQA